MYIADLTEVLVTRKNLQQPASEWVLCLADLSLALPLDRTVASLEGMNELTLVRGQWAAEHGLRGDMRGGDPSASIFKRVSEPVPLARFGAAGDFSQTYKVGHGERSVEGRRQQRRAKRGRESEGCMEAGSRGPRGVKARAGCRAEALPV